MKMYEEETTNGNLKLIMEYSSNINNWISFEFIDISDKKNSKSIFKFHWKVTDKIEAYLAIASLDNWPPKMQEKLENIFNSKSKPLSVPWIYFMKDDDNHDKRLLTIQIYNQKGFVNTLRVDKVIIDANKKDEFNKFISNFIKKVLEIEVSDILYLIQ